MLEQEKSNFNVPLISTSTNLFHVVTQNDSRWYLIGKSELKNKVITFGLDRISNLQTLENLFTVDPSFNPDYFFQHSIGITVFDEKPQEIIIKTNNILSKYLTS